MKKGVYMRCELKQTLLAQLARA